MSQTEKDKKQQEFEKLSSILNDANYARSGSEIRNDIWQSLKSGGVSAVQSGIGLTNLMSGGHTGKFIQDNIWDTHKTQENIQSQMSGTAKMQKGQFERAEGFGGKLGVILDNPMLALDGMVQSSPSMVTGGLMGRGIGKLAGINNGVVRSAGGASLEMAGNSAENLRSQNKHGLMTGKDYAAAVGTGVGGAAITYLGGRISKGLGIADVDTMVAGGVRNTINEVKQNATKGGIGYGLAGIGKGAISEGVFEELPQTILETGLENWAKGRSLTKDMAGNAVMGLTSGAGMGAVSGAVSSNWRKPPTPDTDSTNNQTDSTPQPPDNGGNTPLSPDGSPISPTSPNNPNSPNSPDNGNGGVYFDMPHNENQAVGFHGNPVIDTPAIGLQNPIEHTPLDTQADRTDTTAPKTEPISQVGQTQQATPDVPQIANGQDVASEPTPQNTPLADVNPQTFANPQNFDSWLNQEEFVNQYKAQQELNAQKPSERMGLDPNQGSLTRSAVVAVDSGATQAINPQAINPQAGVVAGATGEQAQEGTLARASMQSEPLSAYQTQLQERTAQQEVQAQEAKAVFANAPKLIGKQNYIQNQNERLPTQIMAVEADSLMPSVDNTTNQARDRSRTASRVQVDNIANNLDPMQLTDSTVMGHGSPTISDDGTIIAGNGRTMAIKQAYLQGKADEYRQMLMERADEYGLDKTALAGMKNPVLVKSVGNVGVDKLRQLALNSNETGTMTQSAFENARADVERVANINLNQLKADERGDINTSSNRHIINEFVSQFPIEQQNAMRTSNGVLSKQGLERFENALLLSAYGDNPTTQAILESTDEEVRNVVKAIVATSPTVAKTKQGIQDGITPNDDIASDITEALSMLAKLRREGVKPSDYLAQTNLFGDELSPTGQRLLAFMDANIKSVVKIRQLLYKYYDNLSQEKLKQDDMFGKETQTKQSRLNQALQELGHDQFVQPTTATTATTATAEQARPTSQASQVNERPEKSVSDEQGIGRDDEQVNPNAKSKPQNLSQEKQSIKEMLPENWDGENIRDNRKAIQAVLDNVKDPSFLGVDTVTNISKDERKQAIENIKRWLNTPDEAQKGLTSVLVAPDNSQSTAETSETGGSLALNGSITKSDDADNPKTTFSAPVGAINPHPSNFELNEFGIVEKPSIIWTGVVGGKTVRVSYSNEYDLFSLNGLKTPFMLSNHSQVISRINEEASTYDDTHNQLGELNNLPSGKTLQSNYKKDLKDFKEQVKNSQTNKENDTAVNTTQDLPKVLQDKKGNPKQVIGNRNAKRLLGENGLVDDFDVVKLDNGKYSFVPKENKPFVEPSQDEINEFIDKALNGNIKNELTLFPAGQKEIDIAKQSGVDIAGMYHTLKAENLRHAINSHGQDDSRTDGKRSQQRSLTVDDLKKIPDVLKNFDELTVQKRKENQSSLVYKKQMADGTIEYVERVIETSRENKPRLLSQTVWVGWRATGVISPRPPQVYTPDTPSTTEVASDDSITNSDKAVKQDLTPSQQSALNALEKLPDSDPKKAEFMDAIYGVGTTDSEQDKKARRELVGRVTTYEMVKRNANKLADELSELGYDVKVADSTLFDNTKEVATQLTAKKSGKTLNVMVNKTLPQGRSNDNVRDGFFVKDGNVSYRIDFNELNIAQRIDNHTDYVSNKEYFGANRPVYRQNAKPTDWQQRMAGQMARLFDDDPALPQFIELANQRNLSTGHKNSLIGSITSYADVQFKKGNALQKDDVIGKNNDEYHQGKIKFSRMGDVVAPVDEQAKVLQGKAVSVIDESTLDMPKVKGFKAIEKWATNLFEKQGGKAINPTLGEIILNHRSVKDSLAHGKFSPYKNIAFAGVKDVLEKGVIVAVDTIQKSQDSFYISAPVLMNGKENILTVIVHRDVNTQSMYLHSVMTKENLMKPRVSETQEQNSRKHIGSLTSSDIHNILQNALTYKEKSKKELIVTHNISADGIIHADKMGGLPFASIAITKQSNPLDGFGEVTLIGDSHMIDPKGANKAKVFGSDIYSPRYPKVIAKVDRKKLDEINNRLQQSNEFLGYGNTVIADDFSQGRDMDIRELGGVQGLASEFLTDELDLGDELHQAYLNSLLDRQFANNNVELKGTAGFSTNARRAYAHHMSRGGYHIAKLRHTDRLRTELDRMQKHIDENVDNPDYDHVTMQRVVDEMEERHKILLNPPTNPLSTMATSVGFMWYMGLSPASALVNLSQTLLLAYPMMGAKWGFSKAQKELTQASKDWWRIASWREEDGTISWQSLTHADHMKHAKKVLSAEEYDAVDKAFNRGAVDKTQAHDLAGIASGEDGKVSQMMKPAMKVASVMFHEAEVYNRQATFLASYRLARGAGIDHETAIIMADDMTRKAHFDYSQSNRARYMNTPVAKVVLLFKQYSQNMIFTLIRQTALAMPALGKFLHNRFSKNKRAYTQEELEAAKAISAIFAGHALFAGALGLPSAIVTPFLAAATMLGMGGGDDDDWGDRISNGMATLFGSEKAEVAFRNALADVVGNDVAEVVAKGVPRAVGVDLSSRVGLNNLIVPHIQDGLEGQSKWENFMTAMLGPVVGIGGGVVKGWGEFFEGHELRGIETASPKFFKDYLKAYRYATEGHTTKDGKEIVERENVGISDIAQQAIGFRSGKFAQAQEVKSAIYQADKQLTAIRSDLVRQYALAKRDGDDEQMDRIWEEIKRFNVKHPSVKITKPALMQFIRQRQRRIDNAKDGIYLSKNREHLREYGAFGVGG